MGDSGAQTAITATLPPGTSRKEKGKWTTANTTSSGKPHQAEEMLHKRNKPPREKAPDGGVGRPISYYMGRPSWYKTKKTDKKRRTKHQEQARRKKTKENKTKKITAPVICGKSSIDGFNVLQ